MLKLSDVARGCDLLCSTKITDQGKGLNELKQLLEDDKVRKSITISHNANKNPNWNTICASLFDYLRKDCGGFAKSHDSWSEISRTNKTKKLLDVFRFLKRTLRIASSDNVKLDLGSLTEYLIGLLRENLFVLNFGDAIFKIINDAILGDRKISPEIPKSSICELLNICERKMCQEDEKMKFIVSSVLVSLTKVIVKNMDFSDNLQFHDIYVECVKSLDEVKAYNIIENVLAAANLYIKWCSLTHRELCCNFGEDCLDHVLKMWRENSSDTMLPHITLFCLLQITLHHPNMTVEFSLGYYTKNHESWCSKLYNLLIAGDLQLYKVQFGIQHRFKELKATSYDEGCVTLVGKAACVIFKMTQKGCFVMPKTLISCKSFVSCISFDDMTSIISSFNYGPYKNIEEIGKPWFAVLTFLLVNHDGLFNYDVLKSIIVKFHHMLVNASFDSFGFGGISVITHSLMLLANRNKKCILEDDKPQLSSIWKDCWNVAVSCLAITKRDTSIYAVKFLKALVEFDKSIGGNFFIFTGVSKSAKSFWSTLYLQVSPSLDAISLATKIVQLYGLPCDNNTEFSTILQSTPINMEFMECDGYMNVFENNTLKLLILHWVLGFKNESAYEKQIHSTSSLTQCYQNSVKNNFKQITIMTPNTFCKMDDVYDLIKAVSELLASISYKDPKNCDNFLSGQSDKLEVKDVAELFLKHEFVTGFQCFHLKSFSWLENKHGKSNDFVGLPQCDATLELIFGMLHRNMNLIAENMKNCKNNNMSKDLLKICQSFFLYANPVGNLLYLHFKSKKFSSKYFEKWTNIVDQFANTVLTHLEKGNFVVSDDVLSEISGFLSKFLEILSKQAFGPIDWTSKSINSQRMDLFYALFKVILRQFQSEGCQKDLKEEDSPDSHDDVLGLTQSMASNTSSAGHGYKRRKYNVETEPPSKQSKLSDTTNKSTIKTSTDYANDSCLVWDHEFVRNIVRLAVSMQSCFRFDDAVRDILKVGLGLNPGNLYELYCIYTVLDQMSMIEGSLSFQCINDMLDICHDVFHAWYKDQEVSLKFLILFAKITVIILERKDIASHRDVTNKINVIVGIFWGLKSSKKCSHLSRMGISASVLASIPISPKAETRNIFDKIRDLISDAHSSVRGLTVFLLVSKIQSLHQCAILKEYENDLLDFAFQLASHASTKSAIESAEILPLLKTSLHCVFLCLSCCSPRIEEKAHYLLCVIESLGKKFEYSFGCDELCSRCLSWVSKQTFCSVFNCSATQDSFLAAYSTKHLSKSLFNWLTDNPGDLIDKAESFPCTLYGYNNMLMLCRNFVKETFPALLCAIHNHKELTDVYEAYFNDSHKSISLKSLIKLCLPEIFQLVPPSKNLNQDLVTILEDIYQRNNCYQYLLSECLGHVLVDVFMKGGSNASLESMLGHIEKLTKPDGSKLQTAPKMYLSIILSELVFSKQKCTLVDMFTRVRFHFERAWFGHEYKWCTEMYFKIIFLLLKGSKIPDKAIAYFVNDVVSVTTLNFTQVELKMFDTSSQDQLRYGFESANIMVNLLTEVSIFLHGHCLSTKQGHGFNRFAVLIVNLLLKSEMFYKKVCDAGLSDAEDFKSTHQKFATAVESLSELTIFRRLYVFIDESADPSMEDCSEILEECDAAFEDLGITQFCNPIVNKICESFVKNLSLHSELMDIETQTKLIKSILILLDILKTQNLQNMPLVEAVIQIYMHISGFSSPVSLSTTPTPNDPGQLYVSNIMMTLLGAVNSKLSDISGTALTCLKNLVKISDIKSYLQAISQKDDLLNSIITLLKTDTDKQITYVPLGVERLKASVEDIENVHNQEDLLCLFTSCMIDFCQNTLFHTLKPICYKMEKMSALILPRVIHDILLHDPTRKAKNEISKYFRRCFKRSIDEQQQDKRICIFLDVMQYLRTLDVSEIDIQFQKQGKTAVKTTSWDNNFWLDIDYMDLARVAVHYNRPYMAVLYVEIWKETFENKPTLKTFSTCRSLSRALNGFLDQDSQNEPDNIPTPPDNDELVNGILIRAYCKINDLDSLYGLAGNSWNPALMMHIHSMESNWFEALDEYNMLMTKSTSASSANGIIQSLRCLGLAHIAEIYINSCSSTPIVNDQEIEATSQLRKWDDVSTDKSFFSNLSQCQSYLKDRHPSFHPLINCMWNDIVSSLESEISPLNLLGNKTLDCIGKLTVIRDLLFAKKVMLEDNRSQDGATEDSIDKLSLTLIPFESLLLSSYSCAESIILNRNRLVEILIHAMKNRCNEATARNVIHGNLTLQIDLAIKTSREKMALQLIESAMNDITISSDHFNLNTNEEYHRLLLKKAQVLWNANKKIHAISVSMDLCHILQSNVKDNVKMNKSHVSYHLAKVLQLSGKWINEMKMESPSTIMENYFKKSVVEASKPSSHHQDSLLTEATFDRLRVSGYKTLAKFADGQYREIVDYMTSKEFQHKRNLAREAKQEISKTTTKPVQGQNQKYLILLQKNYQMDHRDFTNILDQKEKFLLCAVENYIKCLTISDKDDLLMYRICALWLENTQSASLPALMLCARSELKSYKFVDISYQLAARLDKKSQDKNFQSILCKLLKKLAVDHPHHVLPILFALANAHRDADFPKLRQKKTTPSTNDSTSQAAKSIINEVKNVKPQLVSLMANLSDAYIEFANIDVSRYSKTSTPISFEKNLLITKYCDSRMKNKYEGLAIPTIEIPVDKNGNYEVSMQSASLSYFKGYFQLCGGINLPKIVVACASDGSERKHLVKGRDDLRQDAVMQHVFKVVNALLMHHEGPQNLRMCTYKVVPLSQRSGLVEWCEGTIPIGNYLIGVPSQRNFGAHHLYRPKDLISVECRKKLHAANGKSHRQKLEVYHDICERFQPVFRHFFYENFIVPYKWFQSRTAYCKSVSISSIVGYILGLGDRHVQNILINRSTGEVIHIDLGVAFEQGKCLPTPEMVPFRLTRDIVDAFGSSGVEGSFRRNCERCLEVLRSSTDVIATIVEVLLHDPLHDWMMTSNKAMQVQRDDASNIESEMTASVLNASTVAELLQNEVASTSGSTSRSSLAGRALLRVKEKLRGLESGSVLSVEGQVNMLIQQATDEEKLCAMFVGWQPYI